MKKRNRIVSLALGASVCVVPFVSGCGGGVSTDVTVTTKRSASKKNDKNAGAANSGASNHDARAAGGVGTFQGKVVFDGRPPELALLIKKGQNIKDKAVCAAVDLPNERLVIGPGRGVQNVFVYLPKAPRGASFPHPTTSPVIFDQKGCRFIPHVLLVRTDQPVNILSGDAIAHNTHTLPKRNSVFNQVIPPNDRKGVIFKYGRSEAAPIEVRCDFHSWMIAYHLPLDHPYAAITKADGSFEIQNLPVGTHKFRVWQEAARGGYLSRNLSVTIRANEVTTLEIPYPAASFAENTKPSKSVKLSRLLK